jgi:hypothetical protein
MGYELNTKAYKILIQIEVSIREFFICLIKKEGINDWHESFLGKVQKESLKDIALRINEAKKNNLLPNIEDQYIFKLNRALKDKKNSFEPNNLKHPFYYLNWPDMESLLMLKSNVHHIDKVIGKPNRELLASNLKSINLIRNDIAHSRFISENDFKIISGAYNQISGLIPSFDQYKNQQTEEHYYTNLLHHLNSNLCLLSEKDKLEINEIDSLNNCIENCLNSFWLNTFRPEILKNIKVLKFKLNEYYKHRNLPGGLLNILRWKYQNKTLINQIKTLINE